MSVLTLWDSSGSSPHRIRWSHGQRQKQGWQDSVWPDFWHRDLKSQRSMPRGVRETRATSPQADALWWGSCSSYFISLLRSSVRELSLNVLEWGRVVL